MTRPARAHARFVRWAVVCCALLLVAACGAPAPRAEDRTAALGGGATAAEASPLPAAAPATEEVPEAIAVVPPETHPAPAPAPPPPAVSSSVIAPLGPPPVRVRQAPPPVVEARAAVVVDGDSGAVLFEKDAHTPLPPASTTKILTALLALERGNLDDVVEVALDNRAYWGSVMGLRDGDRFTLRDLLYGLLLPSGNDAAYVIAVHIAGSEGEFAELMNRRMRELGLRENRFRNASGLGRDTGNQVSAYDLAHLARVAMRNQEFARIVATRAYTARGSRVIAMTNGNGLLAILPGADGVKIGWGGRFGGNTIVGSATRNGHRLFVVLLDVPNRDGAAAALLTWAFAAFAWESG
jgi:D-alanyl-D-alanine carboxypeptidase (penicillin-binding protein 5/6)